MLLLFSANRDLLSGAQGNTETAELSFICSIDFSDKKKKKVTHRHTRS